MLTEVEQIIKKSVKLIIIISIKRKKWQKNILTGRKINLFPLATISKLSGLASV